MAARKTPARGAAVQGSTAPPPAIPEPHRPLGATGRRLWDQVWAKGELRGTVEAFLMLCEQLDERASLRVTVLRHGDRHDRAGLRALDEQIIRHLSTLGLSPTIPEGDSDIDDWTTRAGAAPDRDAAKRRAANPGRRGGRGGEAARPAADAVAATRRGRAARVRP
jgi:hypothetical protein